MRLAGGDDESRSSNDQPDLTVVEFVHLTAAGVSVLLDVRGGLLPAIAHWGADLGPLDAAAARAVVIAGVAAHAGNTVDEPVRVAVLPEHRAGWAGRPGLNGSRDGGDWSPWFRDSVLEARTSGGLPVEAADGLLTLVDGGSVAVTARDRLASLGLAIDIELSPSGVLRLAATLTNTGEPYRMDELSLALPIPPRARELFDFAGHWGKERVPQRGTLEVGTHLREGRRGRTGADAATLLSAGEPGFGFARGEVWGVHVGFSGNHRHYAERLSTGEQVLGGGELLLPGEIVLNTGDQYRTPWLYAVYGDGLDEQARRLHRHLRARPQHPSRPRPVTLNVWEAVYFHHDLSQLTALAERAAAIGVERYVLDDGWFRHRRDDTAGLGDWYVDETVWPDGLTPLIDRVRALGMEFGLWVEPEMISTDSDLARAHPEWIMRTGGRLPVESRHQQVLNLGDPEAYAYVRDRLVDILTRNDIAYLKWDHNRDLVDAGAGPRARPGVHAQTHAAYRLMDELRRRFPGLEIESCSSGGGRVDLGVIDRTDRVWVSDCIDPHERQQIHRWTLQLLPPELLGAHIASSRSHTTGRRHDLAFRAATAVAGHLGIEWNLLEADDEELRALASWVTFYRANRSFLHSGDMVRMDQIDPALHVSGVVSPSRERALYWVVAVDVSDVSSPGRITLRGLDPARRYVIRPLPHSDPAAGGPLPPWFAGADGALPTGADGSTPLSPRLSTDARPGIVLTGQALALTGVAAPPAGPDTAWLLEATLA
ncbi:alpha-galactosidase [Leifsonia sp. 21MFCrub1.1]|uniref:alpha-galactosidase n=1 Tax=Leifsonia sp. 21MFCrub1.1 TaxID=1798223 RepID=UPI0008929DE8|nr:alpha-galactosidase [Leifsonia sp. 21MFCrub1.1]SEB10066.1 alpha-galactosidase [Leifsonia sp. 21MFCrub1.1]